MDFEALLPVWAIVCPLVFFGGMLDAIAGGGGLITLPAYLLAGFSPHAAVATNKCGNVVGTALAAWRFIRLGHVHRDAAVISGVMALVGASLGAKLNMILPSHILYYIMLVAVPLLAVFIMTKRDFGTESHTDRFSPKMLLVISGLVGFALGGYDGFFGPGAGTFMMLAFTAVCGFDLLTASGNTKVANTASNAASMVTFALAGEVVWAVGIPAMFFGIAGAQVGTNLALKNGGKIIRPMFLVMLTILVAKLAWDLVMS